jgi:predicted  nucleic acid-binding Zn ribbon protein
MYFQEISFQLPPNFNEEEVENKFINLLVAYRNNGQIQDASINNIFVNDTNKAIAKPITIAKDSLKKKYNSNFITNRINELESFFTTKLEYNLLGRTLVNTMGHCKCPKSEFYILYTNFLAIGSPITCGSCFNDVPLYKIPKYDEYGYMPILSWESNYKSCDTLQMNGLVGEIWAMKQMWQHNSALSKQGIEICKKITQLSNIPTYYYLYNYRRISHKKDLARKCPSCKGEWLIKPINEDLGNVFDFKCDKCRLVSPFSSNSY